MFDFDHWFDNVFWPTYPRDLCNRIGSKSKAQTAGKAKIKSDELAEKVVSSLREQIRYYRKLKKTGKHESAWKLPMCSTWMNGERWNDEIGSHYELNAAIASKKCACGNDTKINNLCMECYDKIPRDDWREKMLWEYFVRHNLAQQATETRIEWVTRLRDKAKKDFRKFT